MIITLIRRVLSAASYALLAGTLGALLSGCMPDYNWREVRVADQHYVVTMPGKTASMSRPIDLDGLRLAMSMQGVKVNDVTYTVASVPLPDNSAATQAKVLAAMQTGMLRNIGGKTTASLEHKTTVVDASDKKIAESIGIKIIALGTPPSTVDQPAKPEKLALHGLFVAHNQKAWQVVVMGPEAAFKNANTLETDRKSVV